MSYARSLCLGLALASGCAGETFDLLGEPTIQAGGGGMAGNAGSSGNGGSVAGRMGGGGGSTNFPTPDGGEAGSEYPGCPDNDCFPYCFDNEDCKPQFGLGYCRVDINRCVACVENRQCPAFGDKCDPLTNSCRTACVVESEAIDCPGSSRPRCNKGRGVCVECLVGEEDCKRPGARQCAYDGTCVECLSGADCAMSSRPICQQPGYGATVAPWTCRACLNDFECDGRRCDRGSCVPYENQPDEP